VYAYGPHNPQTARRFAHGRADQDIHRMTRHLVALFAGLWLYGFSMAVMSRAAMGSTVGCVPSGLTRHVPSSFGIVTAVTGAVVLPASIPLRQQLGVRTVSNVVLVEVSVDLGLWPLPEKGHAPRGAAAHYSPVAARMPIVLG
jgi:uncharacterized membrane protein YczE